LARLMFLNQTMHLLLTLMELWKYVERLSKSLGGPWQGWYSWTKQCIHSEP
jgi:hypothetical protein